MRKLFILILLPALLGSCNAISSLVHDDQVVAKVGKNKLYKSELERFNYNRGDTETLVNKPLAIPGIYWSVFLREDPDKIKVSCRSQGEFSVNDICSRYFNGGGHKNAAGGDFTGTIDEAVQVFHQVLADLFPATTEQQTQEQ